MRLADLSVSEMIQLAQNLLDLLTGDKLSAIDPVVRAALVASIGTKPGRVSQLHKDANIRLAEAYSLFEARDAELKSLTTNVRQAKDFLKGGVAPAEQFLLAGFNVTRKAAHIYVAKKPSRLSVIGYSNVGNKGTFNGNNRSGAVVYEIWRREGKDGEWMLATQTRNGKFTDHQVRFGARYEYRVRAVAAKSTSAFSNTASVGGK